MDFEQSIPAIVDKGFIKYFEEIDPQVIKEETLDYEGEGDKAFQKTLFRDKDYVQLNRSANVLIYFFNEAIKEINDTDYTPNNENFKPNEKQTYIINLLKRFKDYVESYNKYSLNELKNKLNQLNNDFLKILDEETRTLLFRKCVSKIYKIRDKVLPKNQDFKKLFEQIYPTITDEEANKLNNKTIKPIQKVLDTIKIIQPIQSGLKPLQIKTDKSKVKVSKQTVPTPGIIKNFAYNKLDDKTIDLFKNSFVNESIKIDDYCDIDKKNILDFKKLLDSYMLKIDEYNKAKTENEKSFIQGQIQHYKNELTKTYLELQNLNKYINFFLGIKKDKEKINRALQLITYKYFDFDTLNDVSKLHEDTDNLRELELYAPIYNNYCEDFKKLSVAQQNFIKDRVFNSKTIFDDEINDDFINNIKKDEIKAYIYFYLDDFKYIYTLFYPNDETYSVLKMNNNPEKVITKSGLIKREVDNMSNDISKEIKPYYLLSMYIQALLSELSLIKDNSFVSSSFTDIYNNSIDNTFELVLKAFGLDNTTNYEDLINFIKGKGDKVLKKYRELQREEDDYFEQEKKDFEENKEMYEALAAQDQMEAEEEARKMEEFERQIAIMLSNMEPIKAILDKVRAGQTLTEQEQKNLKRFYDSKFDEIRESSKYKKLSKERKKEIIDNFYKSYEEIKRQQAALHQEIPFLNDSDNEYEVIDGDGLFKGGALFDEIKGSDKDKINFIETMYNKLKEVIEKTLDIKLDTKLPDLTILLLKNVEEKEKKGGVIVSEKQTKEKELPFNPPQKSIPERVNMIKEKKYLRNVRISNFNRTQIRNALNDMNNAGLYNTLNQIDPNYLKNLAGNGEFLKGNIKNHISYIKNKCDKL